MTGPDVQLLWGGFFEPVLDALLIRSGRSIAYREWIVFLLLVVIEDSSDSLDRLVLEGAQPPYAVASLNRWVLAESQDLHLALFEDLLHGYLLRLVQVKSSSERFDAIVEGGGAASGVSRMRWSRGSCCCRSSGLCGSRRAGLIPLSSQRRHAESTYRQQLQA